MDSELEKCDKEKEESSSDAVSDKTSLRTKANNPMYNLFYGRVKIEGKNQVFLYYISQCLNITGKAGLILTRFYIEIVQQNQFFSLFCTAKSTELLKVFLTPIRICS